MKIFSDKYKFNFPYLYDETQEVAKKYNAVCTPDFFGFDKDLRLKYRGRIDSGIMNANQNSNIDDLLPLVYDDVPEMLYPIAKMSLLAHLIKLVEDGKILSKDNLYSSS